MAKTRLRSTRSSGLRSAGGLPDAKPSESPNNERNERVAEPALRRRRNGIEEGHSCEQQEQHRYGRNRHVERSQDAEALAEDGSGDGNEHIDENEAERTERAAIVEDVDRCYAQRQCN